MAQMSHEDYNEQTHPEAETKASLEREVELTPRHPLVRVLALIGAAALIVLTILLFCGLLQLPPLDGGQAGSSNPESPQVSLKTG